MRNRKYSLLQLIVQGIGNGKGNAGMRRAYWLKNLGDWDVSTQHGCNTTWTPKWASKWISHLQVVNTKRTNIYTWIQ